MLKSGNFYKLGEGPINYGWNLRFFVLDGIISISFINSFSRNELRFDILSNRGGSEGKRHS